MYDITYDENGDAHLVFFDRTYSVKSMIKHSNKGLLKELDIELFLWQQKKTNNENGRNFDFTITIKDLINITVTDCPITGTYWNDWYLNELYNDGNYRHLPQIDRINNDYGYISDNIWIIRGDWNLLKGYWNGRQLRRMYDKGNHYKAVTKQARYFNIREELLYESLTDGHGDNWFNTRFNLMVELLEAQDNE